MVIFQSACHWQKYHGLNIVMSPLGSTASVLSAPSSPGKKYDKSKWKIFVRVFRFWCPTETEKPEN